MEDVIKARESIAMTRGNPGCRIAKLIDAVLAQIPVGSNRIRFTSVTLYPPRRAAWSRFDSGTSH
jgi:hypothetical protein